jgi:hypothetical protein
MGREVRERLSQLLPWTLGLWLVGVQVHEVLATVGAWATFVFAVTSAWPVQGWRRDAWLHGFLVAALVLPLSAGHLHTGTGVARLADWLLVPGAALAVARLPEPTLHRIASAGIVAMAVNLAAAAAQHLGAWPGPEAFAGLEWTRMGFHRVYEPVPGRDDRFMAGGLLLHRLKYANVTATLCVMAAAAAAVRVRRWPLYAATALVGLAGITVFPHARAASAAVVLTVGLVWIVGAADRRRAALGALGLVLAVSLVSALTPSVRARFAEAFTARGSGERGAITQAGLLAIARHPLTGVGLDRFRPGLFAPEDAPAQAREHPGKAHNQLVTLAAEAGLVATFLLLAALWSWVREGWRALPRGTLVLGGVALFLLLSLVHDPLFHAESSLALMLLLGSGLGLVRRLSPRATSSASPACARRP